MYNADKAMKFITLTSSKLYHIHQNDDHYARSLNQYADHAPSLFLDYCCSDAQFAFLHGHVCKEANACPNTK